MNIYLTFFFSNDEEKNIYCVENFNLRKNKNKFIKIEKTPSKIEKLE